MVVIKPKLLVYLWHIRHTYVTAGLMADAGTPNKTKCVQLVAVEAFMVSP